MSKIFFKLPRMTNECYRNRQGKKSKINLDYFKLDKEADVYG